MAVSSFCLRALSVWTLDIDLPDDRASSPFRRYPVNGRSVGSGREPWRRFRLSQGTGLASHWCLSERRQPSILQITRLILPNGTSEGSTGQEARHRRDAKCASKHAQHCTLNQACTRNLIRLSRRYTTREACHERPHRHHRYWHRRAFRRPRIEIRRPDRTTVRQGPRQRRPHASKRSEAGTLDLGAQYFTARDRRFLDALQHWREEGWSERVETRSLPIPRRPAEPLPGRAATLVGIPRMSAITRALLTDLQVVFSCRITGSSAASSTGTCRTPRDRTTVRSTRS